LGGGEAVAAEVEEVVDPVVSGEETLGVPARLEPLHLPFSSAPGLVGVLGALVQMLWGGGEEMARSPPEATDGAPHATAE